MVQVIIAPYSRGLGRKIRKSGGGGGKVEVKLGPLVVVLSGLITEHCCVNSMAGVTDNR